MAAACAFRTFIVQKGNCQMTFNYFLLSVMFLVPYAFWNLNLNRRNLVDVIAINVRIILDGMYFEVVV